MLLPAASRRLVVRRPALPHIAVRRLVATRRRVVPRTLAATSRRVLVPHRPAAHKPPVTAWRLRLRLRIGVVLALVSAAIVFGIDTAATVALVGEPGLAGLTGLAGLAGLADSVPGPVVKVASLLASVPMLAVAEFVGFVEPEC